MKYMNCLELTKQINAINNQIIRFDDLVSVRKTNEAISIKNEIEGLFGAELAEFTDTFYKHPNQDNYEKLVQRLVDKQSEGKPFTKKELTFIFDVDGLIYRSSLFIDGKIYSIREQRNLEEDTAMIFGCKPEEIAWGEGQIDKDTKTYIGPLFPDIFTKYGYIENISTSFPGRRVRRTKVNIGEKTVSELKHELINKVIKNKYDIDLIQKMNFNIQQTDVAQELETIFIEVKDMGLPVRPTFEQVYARAEELGLELCPAEVGPQLRLQDKYQPETDHYLIAMKQITREDGEPGIFRLEHSHTGLRLYYGWAEPTNQCGALDTFVFCLRSNTVSISK